MIRDRTPHHQALPLCPLRVQAVCRAHRGEMVYLGCLHGNFRIAASTKGALVLEKEGLLVVATEEIHEQLPVFVASKKPTPKRARKEAPPPDLFDPRAGQL